MAAANAGAWEGDPERVCGSGAITGAVGSHRSPHRQREGTCHGLGMRYGLGSLVRISELNSVPSFQVHISSQNHEVVLDISPAEPEKLLKAIAKQTGIAEGEIPVSPYGRQCPTHWGRSARAISGQTTHGTGTTPSTSTRGASAER